MPNLGPTELIIIAIVLIVLFGSKKLPDAARSLGRSMRIFKSEVKEMQNDDQPQAQRPAIEQQGYQHPQYTEQPTQQLVQNPGQYPNQQQ
ncbi:Sec-independent protein translocase subunit TatA [Corynebacterium hindlerae]|uniref:Sec-independent protein translocase subunit TatA n=1 Tax=Corynebacterium hindlerae TaxID=699041 RepID=UPI001AD726CA|nr:Sec-independent protein translocase subunit TatA [Corynebacterium hindlerae]QTH58826.1 Sec-independent protein translocase subunit TatA [Corynebacterium hindlerae]